jgi:hypothetical protein
MIQKRNYIYLLALTAVFFYAPLAYSQTAPVKTEAAPAKTENRS